MNQNYYIQQDQSSSVGGVTTEDFYDFFIEHGVLKGGVDSQDHCWLIL